MNSFLKTNKNLAKYSLIFLIIIPIFGFNFLMSIIGNILLLLFLIPLLIVLIAFISFNSFKSRFINCKECGTISFGISNTCLNCGAELDGNNIQDNKSTSNPSNKTIEIQAEEIK